MNWKKLIELLSGHRVWIQMHNFPDPDAVASAYGLQSFLKYHNITAGICYNGRVDKVSVVKMLTTFHISISLLDEIKVEQGDYIVLVDGQKNNANLTAVPAGAVACIDHHPVYRQCDYVYKDIRITGSCATLITQYFKESNTPMSQVVASALAYGLKMDTDSFNRGVTKLDIEMYEYLFDYSDAALVSSMYNNSIELADLRAYGAAIENIKIYESIGMAHIPFDCEDALVAMVADFILKLEEVTIAIIYAEQKGGLKFSVRSEQQSVHAGNLMVLALQGIGAGGGHATMAGGFVPQQERLLSGEQEDQQICKRFVEAVKKVDEEGMKL